MVISNYNVVCFDVDDTLVKNFLEVADQIKHANEFIHIAEFDRLVVPYYEHIALLKQFKAQGKYIVVWSQGGYKWAEAVVDALGLRSEVDLIMTKPEYYVDDLPASEWTERLYIDTDDQQE